MERIFDFHLQLRKHSFYLIWKFIFSTIMTYCMKSLPMSSLNQFWADFTSKYWLVIAIKTCYKSETHQAIVTVIFAAS